ncbi:MAG: Wzz/FepE/Etk N-terminal domain-containing protein [Methyloceanibacter sp.]|nr:Wzz/FepE/Etk N-terminal domain-containing protein [Methyloceanibacter sp.]
MTNSSSVPPADDIDMRSLGAALWRAKGRIVALSLLAGAITFIALSMMRPLYTSEARILVQNEETAFTRPTAEQGIANYRTALDEQAVQSQVQVLNSRDLILKVVRDLDLTQNADFTRDASGNPVERLLKATGLLGWSQESQEERAANALAEHLDVYQLSNSSVIAIEYTSGDPQLAAQIANELADVYINWQRDAKIEQTKDATAWLDAQIKALRTATAESEEAVEAYKASEGLYAGSNNVTLNAQQLSELNSQLILAEAQESEAQARAKLIKKMLAARGDIDATPEVLNSPLIINLVEQRVLVQRQLAELSATLLPSHPRIQQLRSELSDVRAQIRTEAQKVVRSLENQAQIAAARESSLRASLNDAKSRTAGQSDAQVKLRALEREAKANRDLLESYLARYRDASARHDVGAVPAQAAIVSRAHSPVLPSFPRRGPMTLLITAAAFLLAIGTVLAKAIIVSDVPQRSRVPAAPHEPDELVPSEPEYMSRAEMLALSRMSGSGSNPPRSSVAGPNAKPGVESHPKSASHQKSQSHQKSEGRPKRRLRKRPAATMRNTQQNAPAPAQPSPVEAAAKPERQPEASKRADAGPPMNAPKELPARKEVPAEPTSTKPASKKPTLPVVTEAPAPKAKPDLPPKPMESEADSKKAANATPPPKERKSVWRATKPAKRPSWLAVSEPRSKTLDTPKSEELKQEDPKLTVEKPATKEAAPKAAEKPSTESAAPQNGAPKLPAKAAEGPSSASSAREKATPRPAEEPKSAQETASTREEKPAGSQSSNNIAKSTSKETSVAPEPKKDTKSDKAGVLAALAAPAVATAAKAVLSKPKSKNSDNEEAAKEVSTPDAAPQVEQTNQVKQTSEDSNKSPTGEGGDQPVSSSSMGFIQRIRQDVIKKSEAERATVEAKSRTAGFLDRLRGKNAKSSKADKSPKAEKSPKREVRDEVGPAVAANPIANKQAQENEIAPLSPNDLRHYLTQRIAASDGLDDSERAAESDADAEELGPVIGSLEEVVDTIVESSTGGLPRTMLVAGLSSRAQSPEAAIGIARDLARRNEQVALVDLARGAAVVSGRLNMQRIPGFSDLAAGAVDFADVIKLDDETALQVIPAGNPMLNDDEDAPDNFMRVFEALTQTYDCVVLHADMVAIEHLMPALKFELPVAVAVLPPKARPADERESLSTVQRLGCPVVVYGTTGKHKQRRFSLFGRKVAV